MSEGGGMNDSRVDRVAMHIRDAQAEKDNDVRVMILLDACEEWRGFAAEFPSTDMVIAVVSKRLASAATQFAADQPASAGLSLQVASNAVQAVKQR